MGSQLSLSKNTDVGIKLDDMLITVLAIADGLVIICQRWMVTDQQNYNLV